MCSIFLCTTMFNTRLSTINYQYLVLLCRTRHSDWRFELVTLKLYLDTKSTCISFMRSYAIRHARWKYHITRITRKMSFADFFHDLTAEVNFQFCSQKICTRPILAHMGQITIYSRPRRSSIRGYKVLCGICIIQIQPRKHGLDHADYR